MKYSRDQIFRENSLADDKTVKKHYLREIGDEGYKCACCGISRWQGTELVLQLDHINGIHMDNRWSNLRLLCPNCHTQTPTYAGKNSWAASLITDEELIDAINSSQSLSMALRLVNMDVGRTEYFSRAKQLIDDGLAELNKTTYSILF